MNNDELIAQNKDLIFELYNWIKNHLGFQEDPVISFIKNKQNAQDVFGRTGYYDPNIKKVVVFITGRHMKDILRSLAHELVHHNQNCRGDFVNKMGETSDNYAQNNEYLREREREAYEVGNLLFRDFEDNYKTARKYEKL